MTIDITKARALCKAATPGPWEARPPKSSNRRVFMPDDTIEISPVGGGLVAALYRVNWPDGNDEGNAAFIVAARTLLPEALDEIERLQKEVADLQVALDYVRSQAFAATNPANWQVRDTPEERIRTYEDVLRAIESGERFWTAEKQLEMCQKVVADVHAAEVERLLAERWTPVGDNHHNAYLCPYCNPDREAREAKIERLREELAAWRAKQPLLDKISDLLGVCEGVDPLRAAVTEIERLRAENAELRQR